MQQEEKEYEVFVNYSNKQYMRDFEYVDESPGQPEIVDNFDIWVQT